VMLEQFGCVAPVLVHEEKLQGLLLADRLAVREYEGPPQPRNMPTISLASSLYDQAMEITCNTQESFNLFMERRFKHCHYLPLATPRS
jgi:hypothetical protein